MRAMRPAAPAPGDDDRFTALWDTCAGRVFAYASRHVDHHTAQEVVSETFLVAWRRLPDVPDPALPWLLVVARNTIANQHRGDRRRDALAERMARVEEAAAPGPDVTIGDRDEVLTALAALTATEREALLLTAWDGLSAGEAARVVGCSAAAMHVRLFRARRRLRAGVAADPDPDTTATAALPLVSTEPRSTR